MSLDSLGSLRSLLQAREQGASIQNDKLEQVQAAVQQTGTSEAQRMDQLGLEKLKAEYDVALQAALKERLESQKAREEKAVVVAQATAFFAGSASLLGNAFDSLFKKDKLGEQSVDRKADFSSGKNSTYLDTSRSGKNDLYTVNVTADGRSDVARTTAQDGKGVSDARVATLENRDIQDGLVKAGFLKRDDQGNLSLTDKGSAAGLKLGEQKTEAVTGKDELSKLAEGDLIRKGEDGKYFVTDKGAKEGLTLDGDKVVKKVGDIQVSRGDGSKSQFNFNDLYALDKGAAIGVFEDKKRDFTRSEASAFKDASKGFGATSHDPKALFTVHADGSNTINGANKTEQDAKREELEKRGILTYGVKQDYAVINSDGSFDSGKIDKTKIDAETYTRLASGKDVVDSSGNINVGRLSNEERRSLVAQGVLADKFDINKASEQGVVQRNIGDFDDKLGDYFKATKSIGKNTGENILDSVGNGGKNLFNLATEFVNDAAPFIQAWLAAKDRLANTEEQLKEATDKLAASLKKLKELELAIAGPHKDDAAEGGETGDE